MQSNEYNWLSRAFVFFLFYWCSVNSLEKNFLPSSYELPDRIGHFHLHSKVVTKSTYLWINSDDNWHLSTLAKSTRWSIGNCFIGIHEEIFLHRSWECIRHHSMKIIVQTWFDWEMIYWSQLFLRLIREKQTKHIRLISLINTRKESSFFLERKSSVLDLRSRLPDFRSVCRQRSSMETKAKSLD